MILPDTYSYNPPRGRLLSNPCEDPDWEKCWKGPGKTRAPSESCYKSTLIVPMAVRKSELSGEFGNFFTEDTTVGYLCFDHRCINYFREDDINVGYIFADILSLYMITRIMYTSNSETFLDIAQKLHVRWDPYRIIESAYRRG